MLKILFCTFCLLLAMPAIHVQAGELFMPGAAMETASAAEKQVVTASRMAEGAIAAIRQRVGVPETDESLSVQALGVQQDIEVPAGTVEITVDLPYGIRYNTPTAASVSVYVDGRLVAKPMLRFDVTLYQQVVVAARTITPKEVLTPDSLRYDKMNIGRLGTNYFTDINKVAGFVARRGIEPGTPLNDTLLEKPILVKRGSMVNIVARIGDIEVSAIGQAMQNGREGQIIRVQNINSRKIVAAKVIDAGMVEALASR